jgi:protein-tyrosine-phosphatase
VAAAIYNQLSINRELRAESRGTVVLFPQPANAKAVAVGKSKGIDLENHRTRQLEEDDLGEDRLVLVMSDRLKAGIYEDYKNAVNVYTIKEFVDEVGDMGDPYGGDLQSYGDFFDEMERIISKVVTRIEQ